MESKVRVPQNETQKFPVEFLISSSAMELFSMSGSPFFFFFPAPLTSGKKTASS